MVRAQDGCTPGPKGCADRAGQIRNMYNNGRGCNYKCGRFTGVCAKSGHCVMERVADNLCEDTLPNNACGIPVANAPTASRSPTSSPSPTPTQSLLTASISASLSTQATDQLFIYITISLIYLAVIYFAIGIKGQFKSFILIGFFILGGIIGKELNNYETGLIIAIILSLVLW